MAAPARVSADARIDFESECSKAENTELKFRWYHRKESECLESKATIKV